MGYYIICLEQKEVWHNRKDHRLRGLYTEIQTIESVELKTLEPVSSSLKREDYSHLIEYG